MAKLFSRSEIVNRHNQPIYYFSRCNGNTELEKYKNSFIFTAFRKEYIVQGKNDVLTCIVWYNSSSHSEDCGHFMKVFNSSGELIMDTFSGLQLQDDSLDSVEETLTDLNFL